MHQLNKERCMFQCNQLDPSEEPIMLAHAQIRIGMWHVKFFSLSEFYDGEPWSCVRAYLPLYFDGRENSDGCNAANG